MKNSVKSSHNKIVLLYVSGIIFIILSSLLGLMLGSTRVSLKDLCLAFTEGFKSSTEGRIFLYVRIPRTFSAIVCGGALAVSGAVIQNVLANRLASPGIIGVNSGAGLGVTAATALGLFGSIYMPAFAFLGAFSSVMLVSLISRRIGASRGTVILLGVAMNSLLNAISDTLVTFFPEIGVMSNDFKVGDLSAVTLDSLLPAAILILISTLVLITLSNELEVLTLGDEQAKSLGMNASLMRVIFLLLAALLAGCAVSLGGLLSFVGLIVPHIIRRIGGNKSKHLIPLCAVFGGAFLCLCDTASRTAFSPYEIPVGIIMSFIGAPFFVFILIKGKGGHGND